MENETKPRNNNKEYNTINFQIFDNITNADPFTSDPNDKTPLMDKLINSAGYTSLHYQILTFTSFILFIDGIQMSLLTATFIPFQNYYNLSEYEVSLISSSMFLAVGLGSFLTTLTILGNRKKSLIIFTFSLFVLNLILGLIPSLFIFITLRLLIGVSIGILMPLINNLLCEFLPIKNRSFFMVIVGTSFSFGSIFLNLLMLLFMPNLEKENLHLVYTVVSFPALIFSIIMYFYLKESPRYLIFNNQEEKGFLILNRMIPSGYILDQDQKSLIVKQIKEGGNTNENSHTKNSSLKSLFEPKYNLISIILILLWMINSFLVYGGSIALSLTIKYIEEMKNKGDVNSVDKIINNSAIIKEQIIINLLVLPGGFIAGYMTETKLFGRKMTIFTGFLFIGIFSTCAVMNIDNFAIFFGLSGLFISLSFSGSNSYSSEVYPTRIRYLALGFLYFCTRISGFLSQFIAIILFKLHYLAQFYLSIAICSIACVLTYMLPYDTYGRALDTDMDKDNERIEESIKKTREENINVL